MGLSRTEEAVRAERGDQSAERSQAAPGGRCRDTPLSAAGARARSPWRVRAHTDLLRPHWPPSVGCGGGGTEARVSALRAGAVHVAKHFWAQKRKTRRPKPRRRTGQSRSHQAVPCSSRAGPAGAPRPACPRLRSARSLGATDLPSTGPQGHQHKAASSGATVW